MLQRVRRVSEDTFQMRLTGEEREALRVIPERLRAMLLSQSEEINPAMERLFPPAFLDDPEQARAFDDLVREDLVDQRLEAIDEMEESLWSKRLTEEQLMAWMGAINDYRLVLGVELNVSEDLNAELYAGDHDLRDGFLLYRFLSMLQEHMIKALAGPVNAKIAWELMRYQQEQDHVDDA